MRRVAGTPAAPIEQQRVVPKLEIAIFLIATCIDGSSTSGQFEGENVIAQREPPGDDTADRYFSVKT